MVAVSKKLDLVIVGGGQAGLAAAHEAAQRQLTYVVLDRNARTGDPWRERYDSLVLFTPNRHSTLAGQTINGDGGAYPTKDELASYLESYAATLNVEHHTEAVALEQSPAGFTTRVADGRSFTSRFSIVATGPFQRSRIPSWSTMLEVPAIHSSAYRNAATIPPGRVLVVGGGNSGAQIAEELAASHTVTMAVSTKMRFVPERILGVSIFDLLFWSGLLNAPTGSLRSQILRRRGDPIFGTTLRQLVKSGSVTLRPSAVEGRGRAVTFLDGSSETFDAVIFCTGYVNDYSWLTIAGALDDAGAPVEDGGLSVAVNGLGFIGLPWMRARSSALVGGVSRDARHVVGQLSEW